MIKHVVMFKLKSEDKETHKSVVLEELRMQLEKLKDTIHEVVSIEVGVNISEQATAYDLILITEFRNLEDLEIYRDHPEHQKVVGLINQVCENRVVVDFIIE